MSTLITGATGFVGRELIKQIDRPIVTSRNRIRALELLGDTVSEIIEWDPVAGPISLPPDLNIDSVINLIGEPIADGRWDRAKKKRIRDSRVVGTQNLVKGIRSLSTKLKTFVSASAVGIYGSQGDRVITESSRLGEGFLSDVCRQWESAASEMRIDGIHVVTIRVGIVFGKGGGALAKLLPIFRWGVGGPLGNGKQYVPWIHVRDLAAMFVWAGSELETSRTLNGCAPNPVTNREMTKALATAVNRPAIIPVPKFGLKFFFGEFAESLFESQRAVPSNAVDNGFQFAFESIDEAIQEIVT